jgi:hypothetical protein
MAAAWQSAPAVAAGNAAPFPAANANPVAVDASGGQPAWSSAPPTSTGGIAQTAGDIATSTASRTVAGVLDVPGAGGSLVQSAPSVANTLIDTARYYAGLPARTDAEKAQAHAAAQQAESSGIGGPIEWAANQLPTAAGVKRFLGFEPYQPQTPIGKAYDKYVGTGIEAIPSVLALGAAGTAPTVAGTGALAGGAASQGAGDVMRMVDPNSPAIPLVQLAAGAVAGGAAGRTAAPEVAGAQTVGDMNAAAKAAYRQLDNSGVSVSRNHFDNGVNIIDQEMYQAGFRPKLHPRTNEALNELKQAQGTPQSMSDLDTLHRISGDAAQSSEPSDAAMGSRLAAKIDDMVHGIQPADLNTPAAMTPGDAFNTWMNARSIWSQMRQTQAIQGIIQKVQDTTNTPDAAAAALRTQFTKFKFDSRNNIRPQYNRLPQQAQIIVDQLIKPARGGGGLFGMFDVKKNPFMGILMSSAAHGTGTVSHILHGLQFLATLGGGRVGAKALPRAQAVQGLVAGGRLAPSVGSSPVLYGLAARQAANTALAGGQNPLLVPFGAGTPALSGQQPSQQ